MNATALIIEDDVDYAAVLERIIQGEGFRTHVETSGEEGLAALADGAVDVVFTDIGLPGIDGVEVTRQVRERAPDTVCIIVSGRATVETAVAAMRAGAFDFVAKSSDPEELRFRLHKALEVSRALRQAALLREREDPAREMVGPSTAMDAVRRQVREVAAVASATALIIGETGTGKELVARAIHRGSGRAAQPLVTVNCASIPRELLESEFFGHERGAFTGAARLKRGLFELAHGGTLFLDEIGEMDLGLQAKLLRVLEERCFKRVGGSEDLRVDLRVIAATNQQLKRLVERGGFRADLLYRLQVFQILVPPLRARAQDILPLARHFMQYYNGQFNKRVTGIEPAAEAALHAFPFPGNVRQLRNMVERAMIVSASDRLTRDGLFGPTTLAGDAAPPAPGSHSTPGPSAPLAAAPGGDEELEQLRQRVAQANEQATALERELLTRALARADGNKLHAAAALGISRYALQRRLRTLGVSA